MPDAMLSFKIGPVQPFIEAARTLRDLWSGSYLLSWLTAHGMKALFDGGKLKPGVQFITPDVDIVPGGGETKNPHAGETKNPLLRAALRLPKLPDGGDPTLACLPHTFAAVIPDGVSASDLRKKCVQECRDEWKRIADAVRGVLREQAGGRMKPFLDSATWDRQIETYFEITCVVRENQGTSPDSEAWVENEWEKLAELLEMTRSVRHVPAYSPVPDEKGRFPVKCSQLGSYEQMGPADFDRAKAYWAGLTRKGNDETPKKKWDGLHGTGLQSSDKLCAVALVKRFTWPFYFAETPDEQLPNRLGVHVHKLRFTDTATMAARKWLAIHDVERGLRAIDPDAVRKEREKWNGQWLHWPLPMNGEDEDCPPEVWDEIREKKRKQGAAPTYFALMHLDGDNMGDLFAGEVGPEGWGFGVGRYRKVTGLVTKFAREVRAEVLKHHGELIYAGGDDVLAFLPTDEAVACAVAIHKLFCDAMEKGAWPEGQSPSLSGGIAVVHSKEDLRFALGQVRGAEKAAKKIGKKHGDPTVKDALALTICKRSGEHSTVAMGWDEAASLQKLVDEFRGNVEKKIPPASDRWTYKLREEMDRLTQPAESAKVAWPVPGPLLALGRAETLRLVGRGEFGSKEKKEAFTDVIRELLEAYQKQMQVRTNDKGQIARNWPDADVLTGFVALCQSASFLARGKE